MIFTVTKATIEHLQYLKDSGAFPLVDKDKLWMTFLQYGTSFTVKNDSDLPLCSGGVISMWEGVGLLWLAVDERMRNYPVTLIETSGSIIEKLQKAGGFHRFEMYIDVSNKRDSKFAEFLGFVCEGTLKKHSALGTDHLMYAKTF
jgi:hypothetical protein